MTVTTQYGCDEMVACTQQAGPGKEIAFVVKGKPAVQRAMQLSYRNRAVPGLHDPSREDKIRFAAAVRKEMAIMGLNRPFFAVGVPLHARVKFVTPVPLIDIHDEALRPHAWPFPHNGDLDNMEKFVFDALDSTLYMNDTHVVKITAIKVYPTNVMERVGWTEMNIKKLDIITIKD
jgi:Holliday junction resolvase RusA-like endonuclease